MYGILLLAMAVRCSLAVELVSENTLLAQAMASVSQDSAAAAAPSGTAGAASDPSIAQKLFEALASVEGQARDSGGTVKIVKPELAKSLLTPECVQKLLDQHNCLRGQIARGLVRGLPPAANMRLMQWDDRLAATARDWASQCIAKQDTPSNRAVPGLTCVTQSVATGWLPDATPLVVDWLEQCANWDPVGGGCRPDRRCDDCRRLASASARFLGCAFQDCRRASGFAVLLVCNYAGGGGDASASGSSAVSPPYAPGPACRACPAAAEQCMQGLCASRGQCEAASAACTDAPCFDNPDCPSPQQLLPGSGGSCRTDAAVCQCPKLCGACGGPSADPSYAPENAARIVARVVATCLTPIVS